MQPIEHPLDHCRPLIVEDNPGDARLLMEAFKRCGVPASNLEVAIDGEQAVLVLSAKALAAATDERARPSFIVLDLWLRRRTGTAVLEWLKSQPALSSVPVMILTGMERVHEMARALELGADSSYLKPFLFSELVETIRTMLARWREIARSSSPTPA